MTVHWDVSAPKAAGFARTQAAYSVTGLVRLLHAQPVSLTRSRSTAPVHANVAPVSTSKAPMKSVLSNANQTARFAALSTTVSTANLGSTNSPTPASVHQHAAPVTSLTLRYVPVLVRLDWS
jgi:hypothetical protein